MPSPDNKKLLVIPEIEKKFLIIDIDLNEIENLSERILAVDVH